MLLRIPPLRRLRLPLFLLLLIPVTLFLLHPYDNSIRLLWRYGNNRFAEKSAERLELLRQVQYFDGPYPVDFGRDISVVVKTGYGTRKRVQALLNALQDDGMRKEALLVVADYADVGDRERDAFKFRGDNVVVRDAVGWIGSAGREWVKEKPKWKKYEEMRKAILSAGDDPKKAEDVTRKVGWELDAMKFVPALHMAVNGLPRTKWILLLDDDSLPMPSSITRLLSYFDPTQRHYIGNPVGPYQERFAHGGSGVLLSWAAVEALFHETNKKVVESGILASMVESAGDITTANTFKKIGIFLDERFDLLFTGEPPWFVKISMKRACLPLAAVHRLRDDRTILESHEKFQKYLKELAAGAHQAKDTTAPKSSTPLIKWYHLFPIFGAPTLDQLAADGPPGGGKGRKEWDYVGYNDPNEGTSETHTGVKSAWDCFAKCRRRPECLAWSWRENDQRCKFADWTMVGDRQKDWVSNVMFDRLRETVSKCGGYEALN